MAKKKKAAPTKNLNKKKQVTQLWYLDKEQLGIIISLLLITFICFSPALSLKKEFTNWDDPVYVTEQKLITSLDAEHVKMMFSPQHDVSLNFHPVTVFSLAVNYYFSGLHPFGYFFTNILFHLLNTFLVFIFLLRLSGKKFWVAAIAALLFGIHPMHVESVAWISERKDVLYCFFFLASCVAYLSYIKTNRVKYLIVCFILFILSCLSKAMAVPLPFILLLIDYYMRRKFSVKTIAEKIPFLVFALWIGFIAVHIQSKEAIGKFEIFTLAQRFTFAAYGFIMYWAKLLLPLRLSAFYPYPSLRGGDIPITYKISPIIALAVIAIPLLLSWKKNKHTFRILLFGITFFVFMIALVLQFFSVGSTIMADRYSYVPYIGAFFMLGMIVNKYFENKKTKSPAILVLAIGCVAFAASSYARVKVWNDSGKLWSDVIEKYPYEVQQTGDVVTVKKVGVITAYKNRGNYYRDHGEMEKAFADYNLLVTVHAQDEGAYNNMGNFYGLSGQEALRKGDSQLASQMFSKALEMYAEADKLKPDNFETMQNRGVTYSTMGDHMKAIENFTAALKVNPGATQLYRNIVAEKLQARMYDESIEDCNRLLAANPNDANLLMYRGTAYANTGKFADAISDLSLSVKINPSDANGWYNLSFAYNRAGNRSSALGAALNAKKYGYAVSDQYLKELQNK